MQLMVPIALVDASLVSSNVVETPPALYNAGTNYAVSATAHVVTTANGVDVYTSLVTPNTGHTPASSPTFWKKTGVTYKVYDVAQAYAINDFAIEPVTHRLYKKLTVGTGHPLSNDTQWQDMGYDNRWKAHDGAVNSQATNPDSYQEVVTFGEFVDTVCIFNVSGGSVRVRVTDSIEGVVYDETFTLTSTSGISDWYAYFYSPIRRIQDIVIQGLPLYAGAQIEVTIEDAGATVGVGAILYGLSEEIGDTQYGTAPRLRDYSVKGEDAFGNIVPIERAYSKNGEFPVWITSEDPTLQAEKVDAIYNRLAALRAQAVVYIGSALYASTVVYGFWSDFSPTIEWWNQTTYNLSVKGLT